MSKKIDWSDARIYYLVIFLVCLIGIFSPIAIPVAPSPSVADGYSAVAALEPGDNVYIWWNLSPSTIKCVFAATDSVVKHLFSIEGINIIMLTHSTPSLPLGDNVIKRTIDLDSTQDHPDYGVKVVDLGFLPGGRETIWFSISEDIRSYVTTDRFGNSLDDLPMMADIEDGSDIALVFQAGAGGSPFCIEAIIGSHVNPHGSEYVLVGEPETIVYAANYYATGKVSGFLPGAIGGLQYENLSGVPGISAQFGTASILISLIVIIGMVAMNIRTLVRTREETA
jgi:hypothetical protein